MDDETATLGGILLGVATVTGIVGMVLAKTKGFFGIGKNEVFSNYDWATIDGGCNTQAEGVHPARYPIQEMQAYDEPPGILNKGEKNG